MSLTIRKATKNDVESLRCLMEEMSGIAITQEQMLNRLRLIEESKIDSLFICEKDGEISGLLGFRIRENFEEQSRFGEISAIVVHESKRARGIGRFMMDYAEDLAHELGCKGMWLVSSFLREEEAHRFYNKLGYQTTGYRFVKIFDQ